MMVKGISKQVIVVDSPDHRYFDQAIFILRSDTAAHTSQNQGFLLKEACRIANRYMQRCGARSPRSLPAPVWLLFGAVPVSLLWLITSL